MSRNRSNPTPPSSGATDGLRDALRNELGELSVRFEEAQLRSDALRRLGRDEAAVDALEESRELLRTYQTRVERALSAAAVEREAEWIMTEAAHSARLSELPMDGTADVVDLTDARERRENRLRRLPATLSAAAASVLVLGMAVASLRAPGRTDNPTTLAASAEVAGPAADGQGGQPRVTATPLPPGFASEEDVLATIDADDPVIGALLTRRRDLLTRLGDVTAVVTPALLEELEEITGQLAEQGLDEELLAWLDDFEAQQPDGSAPDGPDSPSTGESAGDPAADTAETSESDTSESDAPQEPPADDPEEPSDDDDVFGGFGDDEPEDGSDSGGAGAEGSGDGGSKNDEEDDSILG